MATITKEQAVHRLTDAIQGAHLDDLVEIYNELFPESSTTESEADRDLPGLVARIDAHIANGLEVEEILDLWNVVFPRHRRVWFDEEEEVLHYDEKSEAIGQVD